MTSANHKNIKGISKGNMNIEDQNLDSFSKTILCLCTTSHQWYDRKTILWRGYVLLGDSVENPKAFKEQNISVVCSAQGVVVFILGWR